jgi:hypothetical protein
MVKLLTRRELWIALVLSLCLWGVLALVGQKLGLNDDKLRAFTQFSRIFPGLIIGLTVMTMVLTAIEDKKNKDDQNSAGEIETLLKNGLAGTDDQQRQILEELAALRREIKSQPTVSMTAAPATEEKTASPDKSGDISGALSEAMKQISVRDSQIDILATNVNRANIQRNLVRLTQVLEVARSLKARVDSGLSNAKDSFDFLVDDMNSALTDQGVESMEIAVGARVADLPAGSFAAISVVDAPEDSLRGTVKEVRSRCYFIPEEGKKPRFIAAARVILYRA